MGKMEEGQDKRRLVGEGREIWEWEEHGKAEGQGERRRGRGEGGRRREDQQVGGHSLAVRLQSMADC